MCASSRVPRSLANLARPGAHRLMHNRPACRIARLSESLFREIVTCLSSLVSGPNSCLKPSPHAGNTTSGRNALASCRCRPVRASKRAGDYRVLRPKMGDHAIEVNRFGRCANTNLRYRTFKPAGPVGNIRACKALQRQSDLPGQPESAKSRVAAPHLQSAPPTAHNCSRNDRAARPHTGTACSFGWQPVREGIGDA